MANACCSCTFCCSILRWTNGKWRARSKVQHSNPSKVCNARRPNHPLSHNPTPSAPPPFPHMHAKWVQERERDRERVIVWGRRTLVLRIKSSRAMWMRPFESVHLASGWVFGVFGWCSVVQWLSGWLQFYRLQWRTQSNVIEMHTNRKDACKKGFVQDSWESDFISLWLPFHGIALVVALR